MSTSSRPRRPKYRHYKPKDLGVVRLDGRDIYLGKFNSLESLERYHRLIAEWLSDQQPTEVQEANDSDKDEDAHLKAPSVNELMLAYMQFALTYYRRDGAPSREIDGIRDSLRPLRQLYGQSSAIKFGPLCLKTVRQHMIDVQDLCRTETNKRIGRIKRVFRWAASEELIAAHGQRLLARPLARESVPTHV